MNFSFKSPLVIFSILSVVAILVGTIFLLQNMSKPQETRTQAAVPNGTAEVAITPTNITLTQGETKDVVVTLDTKGTRISSVGVKLTYPYTGSSNPLALTSSSIIINPQFAASWNCLNKSAQPVAGSNAGQVQFGCAITEGYNNTTATNLFTLKVTAAADATPQTVTLSFVEATTTVYSRENSQDIAAIPQSKLVVTITAPSGSDDDTGAAATPTPTPTPTPRASSTTTSSSTTSSYGGYASSTTSGNSTSSGARSSSVSATTLPVSGGLTQTATLAILGLLFLGGGLQLASAAAIQPQTTQYTDDGSQQENFED